MKREEVLSVAKPILFNTDMVRAILDGRKTETRRAVKLKYSNTHHEMFTNKYGTRLIEIENDIEGVTFGRSEDGKTWRKLRGYIEPKAPYKSGDYLYVRETWLKTDCFGLLDGYFYKANETPYSRELREEYGFKWHPSIHMPKEAARIFLRVTNVWVERLQDMPHDGPYKEGIHFYGCPNGFTWKSNTNMQNCYLTPMSAMKALWDSTIKKSEMDKYGWDANPWVWVIRFERVNTE